MDMYLSVNSPSIGFLRGTSLTGESNSFLSPAYRRPSTCGYDSSLNEPLISPSNLDKEDVHPSVSSRSRFSASELPPSQQCSFAQATLNGQNNLLYYVSIISIYVMRNIDSRNFSKCSFFFPIDIEVIRRLLQ